MTLSLKKKDQDKPLNKEKIISALIDEASEITKSINFQRE
jgi:hypothetical protein